MKKRILISVLFLAPLLWRGAGAEVLAQNRNIDSLLTLIKSDKPDTNKVNHLNKLSQEYITIGEYDSGLKYGNKALALASSLNIGNRSGWDKGIASAYNNIGIVYLNQGNYHTALKNHLIALKIREEISDKQGIAKSYINIGNIFCYQANYPEALKNYFLALRIREDIKDRQGIAASYNNIGIIYDFQGNYPEALKNYLAALKIYEEFNDKQEISMSYNNIGIIYWNQGNNTEALKNHFAALKLREEILDKLGIASSYNNIGNIYRNQANYTEALKNHLASLKIKNEIGNKQGIAMSYINIGDIYSSQGNSFEALKNYFASLKIQEDIGDKEGIAQSYINMGDVYTELHKLKKAQNYLNMALQMAKEIGSKDNIKKSFRSLAILDSLQGNWKSAYQHHKLFIVYRDSIDNEETKKKTIESSMNFEFEKKEAATKAEQDRKDAITEANKKRQQVVLILVSCVLLLVFVFAGFVVRSLRITRKQKNIIELQKNEVSQQKEMVSEKNKEITDSINYAQRIQRALLASDKMLTENLNSPLQKKYLNFPFPIGEGVLLGRTDEAGRDGAEVSYFIFFQPKDIVSGDFYWATTLANGNFSLVTADSTGHGVPGAIMSMLNISCLNEAVKGQQLTAPNQILNYTRCKVIEHLSNDGSAEGGKDGMDCSIISLERNNSQGMTKLIYSAANNPIWIVRKKEIIELDHDKMPVGKHERDKISFNQHTLELLKGDTVYLITDGYADQFGGPKGKKFMAKALKELLIGISNLPMNDQKEKLAAEFNLWKGNLEQVDDVTIIGIRI